MPRGDVGLDERIDRRSCDAVDHSAVAISPLAFGGCEDGIHPRGREWKPHEQGAYLFDTFLARYHPGANTELIVPSYTHVCFNLIIPQFVN